MNQLNRNSTAESLAPSGANSVWLVWRFMHCLTIAVILIAIPGSSASQIIRTLPLPEGRPALEFVGQFINSGASSQQFGYLVRIEGLGLNDMFSSSTTPNETTAFFTFFTQATTLRTIVNGPLRIIERTGTTTIYFNSTPAGDFANPSSFQSGTPIQVSDYQQQVVFDTTTGVFTTVHLNTITLVETFDLAGRSLRLGHLGKAYRTNYLGHVNAPGMTPSGWFGGYAVGVARGKD